jgi:hypothetical protein
LSFIHNKQAPTHTYTLQSSFESRGTNQGSSKSTSLEPLFISITKRPLEGRIHPGHRYLTIKISQTVYTVVHVQLHSPPWPINRSGAATIYTSLCLTVHDHAPCSSCIPMIACRICTSLIHRTISSVVIVRRISHRHWLCVELRRCGHGTDNRRVAVSCIVAIMCTCRTTSLIRG